MDLIAKYKTKIAELQRKQKTFEAKGLGGACISLQGEIQAYNTVISDLAREGNQPQSENGKLPIPHVSGSLLHDEVFQYELLKQISKWVKQENQFMPLEYIGMFREWLTEVESNDR